MKWIEIFVWMMNAALLIGCACAATVIDDTAGARTLTRVAIFWMAGIAIYFFWHEYPTVKREVWS